MPQHRDRSMNLRDTPVLKLEIADLGYKCSLSCHPREITEHIALDFIFVCNRWPVNCFAVLRIQVIQFQKGWYQVQEVCFNTQLATMRTRASHHLLLKCRTAGHLLSISQLWAPCSAHNQFPQSDELLLTAVKNVKKKKKKTMDLVSSYCIQCSPLNMFLYRFTGNWVTQHLTLCCGCVLHWGQKQGLLILVTYSCKHKSTFSYFQY